MADISIHELRPNGNPFLRRAEQDETSISEWRDWGEERESYGQENYSHSIPKIRNVEIQAILRGLEGRHEVSESETESFYLSNRRLLLLGIAVVCALLIGIWCYKVGMSPLAYGLPAGLAFIYAVLIGISELRFPLGRRG